MAREERKVSWGQRFVFFALVVATVVILPSKAIEMYVHFFLNPGETRPDRYDSDGKGGDDLHWLSVSIRMLTLPVVFLLLWFKKIGRIEGQLLWQNTDKGDEHKSTRLARLSLWMLRSFNLLEVGSDDLPTANDVVARSPWTIASSPDIVLESVVSAKQAQHDLFVVVLFQFYVVGTYFLLVEGYYYAWDDSGLENSVYGFCTGWCNILHMLLFFFWQHSSLTVVYFTMVTILLPISLCSKVSHEACAKLGEELMPKIATSHRVVAFLFARLLSWTIVPYSLIMTGMGKEYPTFATVCLSITVAAFIYSTLCLWQVLAQTTGLMAYTRFKETISRFNGGVTQGSGSEPQAGSVINSEASVSKQREPFLLAIVVQCSVGNLSTWNQLVFSIVVFLQLVAVCRLLDCTTNMTQLCSSGRLGFGLLMNASDLRRNLRKRFPGVPRTKWSIRASFMCIDDLLHTFGGSNRVVPSSAAVYGTVRTHRASIFRMQECMAVSYRWQTDQITIGQTIEGEVVSINMSEWQLINVLTAIEESGCTYVWIDKIAVPQPPLIEQSLYMSAQSTLLTRMMALYASAGTTLVLRHYSASEGDRYHQRAWTSQEYLNGHSLIVRDEPQPTTATIGEMNATLEEGRIYRHNSEGTVKASEMQERAFFDELRNQHNTKIPNAVPMWLLKTTITDNETDDSAPNGSFAGDMEHILVDAMLAHPHHPLLLYAQLAKKVYCFAPIDKIRALLPMLSNVMVANEEELLALVQICQESVRQLIASSPSKNGIKEKQHEHQLMEELARDMLVLMNYSAIEGQEVPIHSAG